MDSSHLEIVQLPVSAWKEYRDIRLKALQNAPQAFTTSYAEVLAYPDIKWQDRLQAVIDGQGLMYFARLNGHIAGMAGAYQDQTVSDRENSAATIISVFVEESARGQGVATQLLNQLLENLKTLGDIKKVHLSVTKGQNSAIALYQKCGFHKTGQTEELKGDGQWHTELHMEKPLAP